MNATVTAAQQEVDRLAAEDQRSQVTCAAALNHQDAALAALAITLTPPRIPRTPPGPLQPLL